jgi:hypothetical protein
VSVEGSRGDTCEQRRPDRPRARDRAPTELAEFGYIQVWHPRMESKPAHQWLRRMLAEAAVPE